ncbi:MAG: preprotein translocase subunit SecG [Steroidobacteraceae bacterium]
MLHIVLTVVQFVSCAGIIALVLIQRGKGADAGAGFGAGASGTVFGARGAGTALSRATAVLVAVFMLNSLALAYMGTKKAEAPKTIFDTAGEVVPAASSPLNITVPAAGANSGAVQIPAPAASPAPAGSAPK